MEWLQMWIVSKKWLIFYQNTVSIYFQNIFLKQNSTKIYRNINKPILRKWFISSLTNLNIRKNFKNSGIITWVLFARIQREARGVQIHEIRDTPIFEEGSETDQRDPSRNPKENRGQLGSQKARHIVYQFRGPVPFPDILFSRKQLN